MLSVRSKLSKCCAIMHRASSLSNKHGVHVLYYSLSMPYIFHIYSMKHVVTHMLQIFIIKLYY